MTYDYGSAYGSVAQYFSQSGGTNSPGKSGGAGYSNDISTGSGSQGDVQSPSASSGSGWISAAASTSTSDKSNFSTPFTQGFGGITNNQIIQSPGATNNASTSPISAPPIGIAAPGGSFSLGGDLSGLLLMAAVAIVVVRFMK